MYFFKGWMANYLLIIYYYCYYFKGWMEGRDDKKHKTDVHHRSLNGEGMFNWRMVFPFKYMVEEKVMVVEKKVSFFFLVYQFYYNGGIYFCNYLVNLGTFLELRHYQAVFATNA